MSNGFLTGSALIVSLLITIMFFLKKSVKNIDTNIFKKMLICNILESMTTTSIVIVALSTNDTNVLKLLNRVDVMLIITWTSLMFFYIYSISSKKMDKQIKNWVWFLNIIIFIFALLLDVDIINENGILNSDGPLTYLGFIGASFYILFMLITVFFFNGKNNKVDKNKYIPVYFLIVMLIVAAILRLSIPEINFISIILSLVDMIMIFTIENPDVKLLKEIQLAKDQAEKSNRVKSEFLSSMSHEIRTPLNALVGFSQLIGMSTTLEEAKENAKDIIESSNTLLNMITNILDIAQVEADNLELAEVEYDIRNTLESIIDLFKYKLSTKNLKLTTKVTKVPKTLIGDVDKIKRIFANLLDNAIKYTDKGKITIGLTGKPDKDFVTLTFIITDTGRGMSKELQENIFKNFIRDKENMDSNISGMGLGLSITKSLIEMMDGTIECASVLKKGTTFKVIWKQRVKK